MKSGLAEAVNLSVHNLLLKINPIFEKLHHMRAKRQAPDQDTKGIVSWNALALRAFIQAGLLLGRDDFLLTGKKALNFIESKMFDSSGKFSRIWQNGKVNQPGTLSDYAGLILALHASYEVDFSLETYYKMQLLKEQIQKDFTPDEIYYGSEADINHLIVQLKSLQDNAIPSGNALAAHVHWLFWNYDYDEIHLDRLEEMLEGIAAQANRGPNHFGYWLQVTDVDDLLRQIPNTKN